MKKIQMLVVVLVLSLVSFTSCLKNDNAKQPVPDLILGIDIPEGFDWSNSDDIKCDFSVMTNKLAKVRLFLDRDSESFATFFAGQSAEEMTVSVPAYVEKLYVSYAKEDGFSNLTEVAVENNKIVYTVPADAKDFTNVESQRAIKGTKANDDYAVITYPAEGWGTVLFEDNWPSYGDYDFNDFVLGYKINLFPSNNNKIRELTVDLIIRAEGGVLPYEIGLRIMDITGGEIDGDPIIDIQSTIDPIKITPNSYNEDDKTPAVINFERIYPNGVMRKFYNNLSNNVITDNTQLAQVRFTIMLRNSVAIEDLSDNSFDFFIIKKDDAVNKREIHVNGYAPINENYNVAIQKEGGNTKLCKNHYLSNNNFVWGIKVPYPIAHGFEYVSIKDSYPNFTKWIESGAKQNKDWYMYPNESNVIKWN